MLLSGRAFGLLFIIVGIHGCGSQKPSDTTLGTGGPKGCSLSPKGEYNALQKRLVFTAQLEVCKDFFLKNTGIFKIKLNYGSNHGGWASGSSMRIDGFVSLPTEKISTLRFELENAIVPGDLQKTVETSSACNKTSLLENACPTLSFSLPSDLSKTASLSLDFTHPLDTVVPPIPQLEIALFL